MSDSSSRPKTLTFISRRAPYGSASARACLEMVLASAVFEQTVNYVFMDDGVYQLRPGQQPDGIAAKNLAATLTALPLYDVENLYVETESLDSRNMLESELVLPVQQCSAAELQRLIKNSDQVFIL